MGLHRCTEAECPHLGQQTNRGCKCHRTDEQVLTEQRDELLEALEFYADRDFDGYDVQVTNYGLSTEEGEIIRDRGERARAAIAKSRVGA